MYMLVKFRADLVRDNRPIITDCGQLVHMNEGKAICEGSIEDCREKLRTLVTPAQHTTLLHFPPITGFFVTSDDRDRYVSSPTTYCGEYYAILDRVQLEEMKNYHTYVLECSSSLPVLGHGDGGMAKTGLLSEFLEFLSVPRMATYWSLQTTDRKEIVMGSQQEVIDTIQQLQGKLL